MVCILKDVKDVGVNEIVVVVQSLSHVQLFCDPWWATWIVAHQAPLSTGFPRQEYWSGLPLPCPGDLPHPGIKPTSPALQADSLPLSHHNESPTMKLHLHIVKLNLTHELYNGKHLLKPPKVWNFFKNYMYECGHIHECMY